MADQIDQDLYISALTVAEIRRGVLEKPKGSAVTSSGAWFAGPEAAGAVRRQGAPLR